MSSPDNTNAITDKKAQFDEFFMIAHKVKVNVKPLADDFTLPDADQLEDVMPFAFRIAGEMASVEAQALRPLRNLGDMARELTDYLNHQARKIDLMMSYILQQQDEPNYRYNTVKFGGGGLVMQSDNAMQIGTKVEMKLFITEEAAAIFCYAEAIACEPSDDKFHISFVYTRIRELDQELLVRASLHLQTAQLKKRNKEK